MKSRLLGLIAVAGAICLGFAGAPQAGAYTVSDCCHTIEVSDPGGWSVGVSADKTGFSFKITLEAKRKPGSDNWYKAYDGPCCPNYYTTETRRCGTTNQPGPSAWVKAEAKKDPGGDIYVSGSAGWGGYWDKDFYCLDAPDPPGGAVKCGSIP